MQTIHAIFGSTSDEEKVLPGIIRAAAELPVEVRVHYASADNTPQKVDDISNYLRDNKARVVISGAGLSNVLSGVVKAAMPFDVVHIGVPIYDSSSNGLTALLSTAEKPPMNPVLCVGINNTYAAVNIANRFLEGLQDVVIYQSNDIIESDARRTGMKELRKAFDELGIPYKVSKFSEIQQDAVIVNPFDYISLGDVDRILAEGRGVQIGVSCAGIHENPGEYGHCLDNTYATGIVSSKGYANAVHMAALLTRNLDVLLNLATKKAEKVSKLLGHNGLTVKGGEVFK